MTRRKQKGPTWDQISFGADLIESRECEKVGRLRPAAGTSSRVLVCPFCGTRLQAYLWSLAGSGKRCDCGAMVGCTGTFHHFADRPGAKT